jgi:hypothetical protein
MTIHGIRLFPMGLLIVLSTSIAGAQNKAVSAPAVTPKPLTAAPDVTPPAPAPAAAEAPARPKNPAELPPKLPKVTCHGDQITISADNATLEAILAAVRGCTGAKIDIPEGAARVRSFEELGPGPVREVLDELLSGTQYNYVIQSSDVNPAKVETVLLSMRVGDKDAPAGLPADLPMTAGRRAWTHMQKFDKPDPSSINADGSLVDPDASAPAEIAPASPAAEATGSTPAQSSATAPEPNPSETAAAPPAPVAPPVVDPGSNADPSKAVEDRITAMQQMFDQRQKMIEKQNQSQTAPQ